MLSPANQTWRELLVAARSDADLRAALLPARESLQAQMLSAATELWGERLTGDDLAAVLSIVVNMLDGLAFSFHQPLPEDPHDDTSPSARRHRRRRRPCRPGRHPRAGLAGRRVLVLDQENRNNLGGQAFWSLGGLFFVDAPEQRRMGIKDSHELASQDWLGSAGFDRLGDGDGPVAARTTGLGSGPRRTSTSPTEKRDYLASSV